MTDTTAQSIRSIGLKTAIVASALVGVWQHKPDLSNGFMNSVYKAFTIQSNLWIAGASLVLISLELLHLLPGRQNMPIPGTNGIIPAWLRVLRFMFLTSILLTWSVFAVLLTPFQTRSYLFSPSNILLHNLTAILALLDYLLDSREAGIHPRALPTALIMPLAYTIFFVSAYEITGRLPVRYFFLDYQKYGWFKVGNGGIGVMYWILILLCVLLALGALVRRLRRLAGKRPIAVALSSVVCMGTLSLLMIMLFAKGQ